MSNNKNRIIVFASILGAILATSILALNPSTITNAGAQMYGDYQYGYDSNYYQDDNRYSYDNNHQKKSYGDIQKIKCVNSNINVNGIDITKIPKDDTATAAANEDAADATGAQNGNGWADKINFNKNLVNICVNVNHNQQTKVTPPPTDGNEPPTCEGCFSDLSQDQLDALFPIMFSGGVAFETLQNLCDTLDGDLNDQQRKDLWLVVSTGLVDAGNISPEEATAILDCLEHLRLLIQP